jgi:hypothetical protein
MLLESHHHPSDWQALDELLSPCISLLEKTVVGRTDSTQKKTPNCYTRLDARTLLPLRVRRVGKRRARTDHISG